MHLVKQVENSLKIETIDTSPDNNFNSETENKSQLIACHQRRVRQGNTEDSSYPLLQRNLESCERNRTDIRDIQISGNLEKCDIDANTDHFFSAKGDLIEDVIETIKGSQVISVKTTKAKGIEVVKSDSGEILVQIGEFSYSVDMEFASTKCKEGSSEILSIQDSLRTCDDGLSVASQSPASSVESDYEIEWNGAAGYLHEGNERGDETHGQCAETVWNQYRPTYQGQDYYQSYGDTVANSNYSLEWPNGKSDTQPLYTGDCSPTYSHSQSKANTSYTSDVVELVRRGEYYNIYSDPLVDSLTKTFTHSPEKDVEHPHLVENHPSSVSMASSLNYSDYYGNNSSTSLQYETFKTENDYHVSNRDSTSPSCSESSECHAVSMATDEHSGWGGSYVQPYRGTQFIEQYPYIAPHCTALTQHTENSYSEDISLSRTSRKDKASNVQPGQINTGLFAPTPSSSVKKLKRGCRLWEFIRNLLLDPSTNPKIIRWENRDKGTFKLVQSKAIAHIWGMKKGNDGMNYEKLSRAMRYYYKRQIFAPVLGKRLVYSFGPRATGWRAEETAE